ncbi:potassium channel subfamily K member 4-like [Acanthaster planci]|uniref:Potassium channel subfamily K member 4-like n=1 Tax=Acanthaster planci TaxID=133434 RepID=A0A8B7XYY1_ACAPL|nr:potassium channel subfamily K member 4-like [Acanthaster planci]
MGGQIFCVVYAIPGIALNGYMLSVIGSTCQVLWNKCRSVFVKGVASIKSGRTRNILAVLATAAVMWFFLILVPALIFVWTENWSLLEAQYFSLVALSTIGFGDITPSHAALPPEYRTVLGETAYRVGVMLYFFVGMALISIVFTGVWRSQKRRMRETMDSTRLMMIKQRLIRRSGHTNLGDAAGDITQRNS